jgi:hypothetical protein
MASRTAQRTRRIAGVVGAACAALIVAFAIATSGSHPGRDSA